ncbi:Vgb family protein [Zobellella maritima]|uniref:Vgb family protein n=1 Tax=Zobellella maritima TaxID=2059725 RepID=UPI000E307F57|nr:hypothetical protein [Zobellella maritima]
MRILLLALGLLLTLWAGAETMDERLDIQEWDVPWDASRPRDPQVDLAGRVWYAGNRNAHIGRLEIADKGDIWYLDFAGGRLGRYQPGPRFFSEWPLPGRHRSQPYGSALDKQNRIWLVDVGSRPNRLMGFDPVELRFFGITPIPSGAGAVRHMYYHSRSNSIWFGTDANTLGQARLGP